MTTPRLAGSSLFAALALLVNLAAAEEEILLSPREFRPEAKTRPGHHQVEFNAPAALALKPGERIRLSLPRGEPYLIVHDRTESHPSGARSWIGRLEGAGDDHRVIITRGKQGDVHGTLRTTRGIFLLQSNSDRLTLIDIDAAGWRRQDRDRDDGLIPPAEKITSTLTSEAAVPSGEVIPFSTDGTTTIDILVLYTPELVSVYGTDAGARTRIEHLLAISNQAYMDSGIALNLRLAAARLVSYPASNPIDTALDDITFATHLSVSQTATWRRQVGADLVTLMRPFDRATTSTCGLAWLGGYGGSDIAYDSAYAYSVIHDGSDISGSGYYCDVYTFPHELGHNMGCAHDRAHASSQGAYPYAYGHGVAGTFGTIMSYIDPGVGKFSSPLIQCNGQPCGIADYADNARSINNTRTAVAAYMDTRRREGIAPLLPIILSD